MISISHDPEDAEDDDDIPVEPDDPDLWRDHAEDEETTREERADFEGWPVI